MCAWICLDHLERFPKIVERREGLILRLVIRFRWPKSFSIRIAHSHKSAVSLAMQQAHVKLLHM